MLRLSEVDEVEIEIEKLISGGDGFGRFEGIAIFVPRSAPGDRLRVRLTERKSGYGRGEIEEILRPGPDRREPPCPHFARCGGCDLQHLKDEAQLRLKAASVVETLRRLAGATELPADFEIISSEVWGYRVRTQLHVGPTDRGTRVGYHARGSNDLVPVSECPVLVPELERELPGLVARIEGTNAVRLDLTAGDGGAWTCSPPHGDLPRGEVETRVGDLRFTYDSRCFFQAHRQLTPKLVSRALGEIADADGEAYDLFSGVGLFGLHLAAHYRRVISVEGDRVATRFARKNAKLNGIDNVQIQSRAVESWIGRLPDDASRVLVDPPRAGLSDKVRQALLRRRPRRLTYVSCQPATLARDLKSLCRIYRMDSLVLLDMFPQTGHMEAVVQMSLDGEP